MLRTQPTDVYDAWVSNEIPFTDPKVYSPQSKNSVGIRSLNDALSRRWQRVPWLRPTSATARTACSTAPPQLLHAPSGVLRSCLLPGRHRVVGEDVGLLLLPVLRVKRISATRCLAAGTLMGHHRSFGCHQAAHVLNRLSSSCLLAHERWFGVTVGLPDAAQDAWMPRKRISMMHFAGQDARDPSSTRRPSGFDGSDLMPGAVSVQGYVLDRNGRLHRWQIRRAMSRQRNPGKSWDAAEVSANTKRGFGHGPEPHKTTSSPRHQTLLLNDLI